LIVLPLLGRRSFRPHNNIGNWGLGLQGFGLQIAWDFEAQKSSSVAKDAAALV